MKRSILAFALVCGVAAAQTYCAASTTTGVCGTDEFISNVTFGSINNTSACATGYTDFTGTISGENVTAGLSYPISVSIGSFFSTDKVTVWCDFDQNSTFDPGESFDLSAPTATTPATGSIAIPVTAVLGVTRMRVAMAWNTPNPQPACGAINYGEREDYTLVINPGIPPFVMTGTTGATVDLGATGGTPGALYFMALTLNAGNQPNGYFYGLDIPFTEIVAEFNAGFPFLGVMDPTGAYLFSIPTPGFGVPIYGVTVEFTPGLLISQATNVVSTLI